MHPTSNIPNQNPTDNHFNNLPKQSSLDGHVVNPLDSSTVPSSLRLLKGTALDNIFSQFHNTSTDTKQIDLGNVFSTINNNKPLLQKPYLLSSIREIFSSIQNRLWGTGEFKSSWEVRRDAVFTIFKTQNSTDLKSSKDYSTYLIEDIKTNIQNASYCYSSESKQKYLDKASEAIALLEQQTDTNERQLMGAVEEVLSIVMNSKDPQLNQIGKTTLLTLLSKVPEMGLETLQKSLEVPSSRVKEIVSQVRNVFLGNGEMKSSLENRREILFDVFESKATSENSPLKTSTHYSKYLTKEIQKNLESARNCLTAGGQKGYLDKAAKALTLLTNQDQLQSIDPASVDEVITNFSPLIEGEKPNSISAIAKNSLPVFISKVPKDVLHDSKKYSLLLVKEIISSLTKASEEEPVTIGEEHNLLEFSGQIEHLGEAEAKTTLLSKQNKASFIDKDEIWNPINVIVDFIKENNNIECKKIAEDALVVVLEKGDYSIVSDLKQAFDDNPNILSHFSNGKDFIKKMGEIAIKQLDNGAIHYDKTLKSKAPLPEIKSDFSLFPFEEKIDVIDLKSEDLQNPSLDLLVKGINVNLDQISKDANRNGRYVIGGVRVERGSIEQALYPGGKRDIQNDEINHQLVKRLEKAQKDPRGQMTNTGPIANVKIAIESLQNKEISEDLVMALFICDFVDHLDKLIDEALGENATSDEKAKKFYQISAQMQQGIFGSSRVGMNQLGFDMIQENGNMSPFEVSQKGIVTCSMDGPIISHYLQKKVELDPNKEDLLTTTMLSSREITEKKSFLEDADYTFDIASIGTYKVTVSKDLNTGKSSTNFTFIEENPMCDLFDKSTVEKLKKEKMMALAEKKRPEVLEELKRGKSTTIDILLQSKHNKIGDQHVAVYLLEDIIQEIEHKGESATEVDRKIIETANQVKEDNGL